MINKRKDYSKECWFCGGNLLEDRGTYKQCRSCGATWNETPKPGELPIVLDRVTFEDGKGKRVHLASYSPSTAVASK